MERKRKFALNTDMELDQTAKKQKTNDETHLHNGKYTLDSDEERDDLNEIGQERTTIGFDDDAKITPFNIDEEMTDLTDQFVFNGQIDISRETYEQLKNKT